jgi:hypothetical protein
MSGLKSFAKPLVTAAMALIMLGFAVSAAQAAPGDNNLVLWQMLCSVDHFGPNDPIVFPGQPGLSHMHSFYGNISTNADSTGASLLAASSSCGRGMGTSDHSGYWIPSLYKLNADGSRTLVTDPNQEMFVYYRRAGGASGPKVQPFPPGLAMVAGNAHTSSPQSPLVTYWDCGGGGPEYPSIPQCAVGPNTTLHADVEFPSCWNGTQLDSPDHMSHMAYADPVTGACPADHPISLPQITFSIYYYDIWGGRQYVLSSHGPYTMHGDFFAAWDPQIQNALVAACLNAGQYCIDVNRDGGQLVAGNNSQIAITLADYSAKPPVVLPTQATPAHTKLVPSPANCGSPTPLAIAPVKPSALANALATPALSRAAPSTPPSALPDKKEVGLASGAIGLSLLGFAGYELRRRLRAHHDREQRLD